MTLFSSDMPSTTSLNGADHPDFSNLFLSSSSKSLLLSLYNNFPSGHLLVFEGPSLDVSTLAATTLATSLVKSLKAKQLDIVVVESDSDRWTIDEINEKIIAPVSFMPIEHSYIIVKNADSLSKTGMDHLLKTVEEPTNNGHFFFIVESKAALSKTLLSRSAATVHLEITDPSERILELSQSLDIKEAELLVNILGPNVLLCSAAEQNTALRELVFAVFTTPFSNYLLNPTSSAFEVFDNLNLLANEYALFKKKESAFKSTLNIKAEVRLLLQLFLNTLASQFQNQLRKVNNSKDFARIINAFTTLDAAAGLIKSYANPVFILAFLFANLQA